MTTTVPTTLICDFCRRPIWEDADENGKPRYRHMVASFDMIDNAHWHVATPFKAQPLLAPTHTYGKRPH